MPTLIIFIALNIVNVILQTFRSLATIKMGKIGASLVNALAYGLYTWVLVMMTCELPLILKCLIVGGANLVGVFVVKWIEEKSRKDKLWEIRATIRKGEESYELKHEIQRANLPHSRIKTDDEKYYIFNIYCATQAESQTAKEILSKYNVKYFVTESKIL